MPTIDELRQILERIDNRSDNAYHEILGEFALDAFTLFVDHVPGDPLASPSRLRLRIDHALARLPEELFDNPVRRLAFEDYLSRRVHCAIRNDERPRGERLIDGDRTLRGILDQLDERFEHRGLDELDPFYRAGTTRETTRGLGASKSLRRSTDCAVCGSASAEKANPAENLRSRPARCRSPGSAKSTDPVRKTLGKVNPFAARAYK